MRDCTSGANFNIFYALVLSAPTELKQKLKLMDIEFSVCTNCFNLFVFKSILICLIFEDLEAQECHKNG